MLHSKQRILAEKVVEGLLLVSRHIWSLLHSQQKHGLPFPENKGCIWCQAFAVNSPGGCIESLFELYQPGALFQVGLF